MVAQVGLIGIHFVPLEDYRRALAAEIALIKAAPRQGGVGEIRIPGERAYREHARRAREGFEIDRRIHDALMALAQGLGGARGRPRRSSRLVAPPGTTW